MAKYKRSNLYFRIVGQISLENHVINRKENLYRVIYFLNKVQFVDLILQSSLVLTLEILEVAFSWREFKVDTAGKAP